MSNSLTEAQRRALAHITTYARSHEAEARRTIDEVLRMSDIARATYDAAARKLKAHTRIALHFHPDRPDATQRSVAEALLEQGVYKSQFETGISNGSVSAHPGGDRDRWEARMFGGAYQLPGVGSGERPKYGALYLLPHPDGPAPRFGSCYLLLSPAVSRRATYTYLDSHRDPKEKGTYEAFDMIMAALLGGAFFDDYVIGEKEATPRKLIDHLLHRLEKSPADPAHGMPSRNLNHYVEAQVHGDISLAADAETLVADPSFQGTATGEALERLCRKYAIALRWHMGFALPADEVPTDFRGPTMPSLARRVAREGIVDPAAIGEAAMDVRRNPGAWRDRGDAQDVLQELKLLWHVLVRYGRPLRTVRR